MFISDRYMYRVFLQCFYISVKIYFFYFLYLLKKYVCLFFFMYQSASQILVPCFFYFRFTDFKYFSHVFYVSLTNMFTVFLYLSATNI